MLDTTTDNDIFSNNNYLLRPSNNVSNSHVYGTFSCDPISLPNANIHAPAESTSDKNDSSHSWSFVGTPSRVEESDSFAYNVSFPNSPIEDMIANMPLLLRDLPNEILVKILYFLLGDSGGHI